jgi:hypothetical protein
MPLEAAISFGREPEYSTTHNSARRKRAGPRLNMGDASEIVALLLYAILFRSKPWAYMKLIRQIVLRVT